MEIKKIREQKGLRQEDIAQALDLDRSTVAKWEAGEAMPRSDKLPKLAKILGCKIDDFYGEV